MCVSKNLKFILSILLVAGFASNVAMAGSEAVGEDGTAYYFLNQDPSYFYVTPKIGWDFSNSGDWQDESGFAVHNGGFNQPSKTANSYIVGIAGGYKFTGFPFRVDVNYFFINDRTFNFEPLYQNYFPGSSLGKADIETQVFLLNAYYDWHTETKATPYIGVGGGEYFNKTDFYTNDPNNPAGSQVQKNNTHGVAWDVVLGVRYDFNPNWALNLEGNYIATAKAVANENWSYSGGTSVVSFASTDNLKTFNILLGLTYKFN